MFLVGEGRCGACNWEAPLYVLARDEAEATRLHNVGVSAGICGECMTNRIRISGWTLY